MRFPVTIRHHASKVKIYAPAKNFAYYRLAYSVAGKRKVQTFAAYSAAREAGERIVRDLASGSQAAGLTATQSRDALAALERLQTLFHHTGRRTSLLAAVSEYAEVSAKLKGFGLGEAVEGFLRTVATIQRQDVAQAVREFLEAAEPLTRATNGRRAQICPKYAYNRRIQLERFAETFPGSAVCDLTKEHLDLFIKSLGEFSPKSRNHYRTAIRQFFKWAVRKDYLPAAHRLCEADGLRPENADTADNAFYTPAEFTALLASAEDSLRPLIAIGGLAGLRTAELLRLDWADVWSVAGHIEITSAKSKTRQRRLVEICPSLQLWLEPHRNQTTGKIWPGEERSFQSHFRKLCEAVKIARTANGLRHAFCTFHFALHSDEGKTSKEAGNSPTMIHAHYKGLATKAEAEKWFAVQPETPANIVHLTATVHA